MNDPLAPWLDEGLVIVLDGAMATELERRGADIDDPLWSARILIDNPALIESVHFDYLAAGADIITTASYQATLPGFAARGIDREASKSLIDLSVRLARDARDRFLDGRSSLRRPPLIAASLGPYGAHLHDGSEYHGRYDADWHAVADHHRRQIELLSGTEADLIAVETIPSLREAEIIVHALADSGDKPAWVAFSCRDEMHLSHGEAFPDAIEAVGHEPCIVAAGVNCTAPDYIEGLLRSAATRANVPLLAYPNSGETWDAASGEWIEGPGKLDWGAFARRWRDAGARLIGGCCRSTPADITLIRETLVVSSRSPD